MRVLYPRCAGLDVHKATVVACARQYTAGCLVEEVETFGTTTPELLRLLDWLTERDVTHVAMEATGVYWKPIWHVLGTSFELVLANAAHVKNVPGRKTDVKDATWLAELLAHGLIRGSFVPGTENQDLRCLMRTRRQLIQERTRHIQRIHKVLEDANVKLASFMTNIMGVSGRRVLAAIVAGETDVDKLVDLMNLGRMKASRQALKDALCGHIRDHHRFMLRLHLDQTEAIERGMEAIEKEVGASLEPFRRAADLLKTMPGIGDEVAWAVIAEIGIDMSRFPSAEHLLSWARLCPRNDESAGKRKSCRTMPGRNWLKPVLVQAAWAAVRKRDSYLGARYARIKSRSGSKKAIVAVAASMLTAAYHMLRNGCVYQDLGAGHFSGIDQKKYVERLVRKLGQCGYEVELRKAA